MKTGVEVMYLYVDLLDNRRALLECARRLGVDYGVIVHVAMHPKHFPTERGDWAWTLLESTASSRRLPPADVVMRWKAVVAQALRLRRRVEELAPEVLHLAFPLSLRDTP